MQLQRPKTGASVAFSGISSLPSVAASSLDGSQLNALVARRSALRSQLAAVEQQLAVLPPSTAASASLPPQQRPAPVPPRAAGPIPVPTLASSGTLRTGPPEGVQPGPAYMQPGGGARGGGGGPPLPGAMLPGHYAFWPKHLPGAASCRLRREVMSRASSAGAKGAGRASAPGAAVSTASAHVSGSSLAPTR